MPETKKIRRCFVVDEKIYNLLPQTKIKNLSKLVEIAIMSAVPYFFENEIRERLISLGINPPQNEEIREVFLKLFPYCQNVDSTIDRTVTFLAKKHGSTVFENNIELKIKACRSRYVFKKAGLL